MVDNPYTHGVNSRRMLLHLDIYHVLRQLLYHLPKFLVSFNFDYLTLTSTDLIPATQKHSKAGAILPIGPALFHMLVCPGCGCFLEETISFCG